MSGNQGNRNRLFYLLCVILALVSVFSLIQIIRDISTTAHIRQVNAQVQDLMPDAEETPQSASSGAPSGTEVDLNSASNLSAAAVTENTSGEAEPSDADASVLTVTASVSDADSGEAAEQVFSSPKTVILTTNAPSGDGSSAKSGTEAEASPAPVRVYQLSDGKMREDIARLMDENPDCTGWLRIPEVVDLPVMYSTEGNYYETHDFYGNESAGGTLFLDTMHPLRGDIQHLVIHGHNMKDGTMFGHLIHYEQETYWKKHPTVTWITPWRTEFYDIFCVAIVSTDYASDQYLNYLTPTTFASESEMGNWLAKLRSLSLHWKEPGATLDDALLTLSTCIGDDRLLVVCKRIQY